MTTTTLIRKSVLWCVLVLLMAICSPLQAKTTKHQKAEAKIAYTLEDYISFNCKRGCVSSRELLKSVKHVARELDIDFKDLLAIVRVESAFQTKARNRGNKGLMQVNVSWHKNKLKGKNVYNVRDNILVGGTIYRDCLVRGKSKNKGLKCYNGNGDRKYISKFTKAKKEISNLNNLDEIEMSKYDGIEIHPPKLLAGPGEDQKLVDAMSKALDVRTERAVDAMNAGKEPEKEFDLEIDGYYLTVRDDGGQAVVVQTPGKEKTVVIDASMVNRPLSVTAGIGVCGKACASCGVSACGDNVVDAITLEVYRKQRAFDEALRFRNESVRDLTLALRVPMDEYRYLIDTYDVIVMDNGVNVAVHETKDVYPDLSKAPVAETVIDLRAALERIRDGDERKVVSIIRAEKPAPKNVGRGLVDPTRYSLDIPKEFVMKLPKQAEVVKVDFEVEHLNSSDADGFVKWLRAKIAMEIGI